MPTTTTMTIEQLTERVEALEKQMAALTATQEPNKKKSKKEKKAESDSEEKSKSKRVSGYILYSNANRDEVKESLSKDGDKPKNTEVMKTLATNWKALSDEEREGWNVKAKELKDEE